MEQLIFEGDPNEVPWEDVEPVPIEEVKFYPGSPKGPLPEDDPKFYSKWWVDN